MKLFFFYGSLRKGYWNQAHLSKEAEYVGTGKTVKPFGLYIGKAVPTVVPCDGKTPLTGDLYRLNDYDAKRIYWLESGYKHDEFEVEVDGQTYKATIFYHDSPEDCAYIMGNFTHVVSGDYTKVMNPDGSHKINGED